MSNSHEYATVHSILVHQAVESLDKVNIYGVITYIGLSKSNTKCTSITIVDKSCKGNEKLKCVIFSNENEMNTIISCCEVGDIFRGHRFKMQIFRGQPQGCCNAKFSSWIRFKRNEATGVTFEGNKNSTIDETDQKMVKELREWLKTNPAVDALYEAHLSRRPTFVPMSEHDSSQITDEQLTSAAALMNMDQTPRPTAPLTATVNATAASTAGAAFSSASFATNLDYYKSRLSGLRLTTFSQMPQEGYIDVVCQVCGICDVKATKFMLVWDATKSKYAVHQEAEFTFEKKFMPGIQSDNQNSVFFSKSIGEYLLQVYVFDEYIPVLETLMPGDFILLRNARTCKPKNSNADMVIKMPGQGTPFKRTLMKLASLSDDLACLSQLNTDVVSVIKTIREKGKELNVRYLDELEFISEFKQSLEQDETFNEMLLKRIQPLNSAEDKKPAPLSRVDLLLNDDENMYLSDEDEEMNLDESSKEKEIMVDVAVNIAAPSNGNQVTEALTEPEKSTKPTQTRRRSPPIQLMAVTSLVVSETPSKPEKSKDASDQPVSPKKSNTIDHYEICSEIYKLKRLTNLTFLAPYLQSDATLLSGVASVPYFTSLQHLSDAAAAAASSMRCKVTAKLFNYSISSCPHIASVFVHCAHCNYVNFTPFHLASMHQSATLSAILADFEQTGCSPQPESIPADKAKNFSLDWIQSAMPIGMQISSTQTSQPAGPTQESVPMMYYECPRCLFSMQSRPHVDDEALAAPTLDYVYRFWFVLRDATSRLDPCLLEGQLAEDFLDSIPAVKFYTSQLKAHQVYKIIHKNFSNKYLFTIETFKLTPPRLGRKLNILYKIVDIEQLIPVKNSVLFNGERMKPK